MSDIKELQTDDHTIKHGHLDVGDGHKVYYEQWGNPKAKTPIISFHGGPGSHYKRNHKNGFDPKIHQVVFFDQRGCGNSLPYGKLEQNTTDDLLNDAVKILDHLGIDKVYVTGSSWGSAMATLFTIKFPKRTIATIVSAIYLAQRKEIEYIDHGLFINYYPEVWEKFVASVPEGSEDDPAAYHYDKLVSGTKDEVTASSKALSDLEVPLLHFDWPGYQTSSDDSEFDYVPYQIYAHYLSQGCFIPEGYILQEAKNIKTPFAIIQGRYDMVCPPKTAFDLHRAIPHSRLYVTLNGHSGGEHENRIVKQALVDTMFV